MWTDQMCPEMQRVSCIGYPGSGDRSKIICFRIWLKKSLDDAAGTDLQLLKSFTFTIAIDIFTAGVEAAYESKL